MWAVNTCRGVRLFVYLHWPMPSGTCRNLWLLCASQPVHPRQMVMHEKHAHLHYNGSFWSNVLSKQMTYWRLKSVLLKSTQGCASHLAPLTQGPINHGPPPISFFTVFVPMGPFYFPLLIQTRKQNMINAFVNPCLTRHEFMPLFFVLVKYISF